MLKQKKAQINDEALMFSKTLDKSHLNNAIEMRNALIEANNDVEDIVINTKDLYEGAF